MRVEVEPTSGCQVTEVKVGQLHPPVDTTVHWHVTNLPCRRDGNCLQKVREGRQGRGEGGRMNLVTEAAGSTPSFPRDDLSWRNRVNLQRNDEANVTAIHASFLSFVRVP